MNKQELVEAVAKELGTSKAGGERAVSAVLCGIAKGVKKDKNVTIHRNNGPNRLGHTILYDTLINEYATSDIVMIYHADMYACPGMDEAVLKQLEPGKVVSATRIEPPLHPDGPEKILKDFGI